MTARYAVGELSDVDVVQNPTAPAVCCIFHKQLDALESNITLAREQGARIQIVLTADGNGHVDPPKVTTTIPSQF